jgi:hypothetical protein
MNWQLFYQLNETYLQTMFVGFVYFVTIAFFILIIKLLGNGLALEVDV